MLEKNQMLFRKFVSWWARINDKVNQHFFRNWAPKGVDGLNNKGQG